MSQDHSFSASPSPPPYRFWGLAGGVALGLMDTLLSRAFGIDYRVNGRDASLLVGAFFGSSFAILGYLLGAVLEARARDREQATRIRLQDEALAATRARLAQSEKLAALGQLATAIAHEVRNPLAVMRSAAQGVLEDERSASAATRQGCEFIIAEIDRLHSVVTSLLAFARPLPLKRRVIRVPELFDRIEQLAREELANAKVRLSRRVEDGVPEIHGDPDLLCQVLLGLIANASEAMASGGEVLLEALSVSGGIQLSVADSGPGVPAELKSRIFEPFFTTRPKGTGLGLAVVQQIVAAHAGSVAVDDRPGGGARFVVQLPERGACSAEAA
jgi:two-component system sensor histidine kinase HydH